LPFNLSAAFHKNTIKSFDTVAAIEEIKKYFDQNPTDKKRAVQQGLEAATENVQWLDQNGESVEQFFLKYA